MAQLPLIDLTAEGITYKVDFDYRNASSPDEGNFGSQQPATAVRRFLVTPWFKRHIFLRWMLGEVAINNTGGGSGTFDDCSLTRTPPQRHPLFLSLWADRVAAVKGFKQAPTRPATGAGTRNYPTAEWDQDGTPVVANHKLAEYESAIIDVEYAFYRFRPMGDGEFNAVGLTEEYQRYTELLDPKTSGEYISLPGMVLKYTRDPSAPSPTDKPHGHSIPYGVGRILPLEEFTMVWHRVPYEVYQDGQYEGSEQTALHKRIHGDPTTGRYPYLGTVNKFPIFGRPAETLLLSGFQAVRRFGPIPTSWEWDLHFTFTFDPYRWNWKYYFQTAADVAVAGRNGWYFVSASGTYPSTDTDPDYGDFLDTPDDDSIYNSRNHAYLFKPCIVAGE